MGVSIVMGVPQNRWFIRENPTKIRMIWGYPYFRKPPYDYLFCCNLFVYQRLSLSLSQLAISQHNLEVWHETSIHWWWLHVAGGGRFFTNEVSIDVLEFAALKHPYEGSVFQTGWHIPEVSLGINFDQISWVILLEVVLHSSIYESLWFTRCFN